MAWDDPIPIGALEHYSYCPRQCFLILQEQTFDENVYTLRGEAVHEHVHDAKVFWETGARVERFMPLWSIRLGLVGRADLVLFFSESPYPIEYKYGRHSAGHHAEIQLCAQALCLEEMTGQPVPRGAIYQATARRRREVQFTNALRAETEETIRQLRLLLDRGILPPPVFDRRCRKCSLVASCLPGVVARGGRLRAVYSRLFQPLEVSPAPDTGGDT